MNKQAVLKGTVILAATNVIVKLIGAFYTVPLAWLIGAEGMGLYGSAYQIYMWLFIISTTGLPIAVSKMVSEEYAVGNKLGAKRVLHAALALMISIGAASSFLLYMGSGMLVNAIGTSKAYFCLIAISPCLLFGAVMSAYRGYFQGMQNMIPTAVSELLEAVVRTGVGLTLAYLFLDKGIQFSAAGAVAGVSFGGLAGMLLIIIIYYLHNRKQRSGTLYKSLEKAKYKLKVISKLLKIAIPITLGASVFSITSLIDLSMIMRRLKDVGFNEVTAVKMYGYLTGYAYKIYSLPLTVIIALCVSIVPVLASAYINKNRVSANKITSAGIRSALIISIPSAIGIAVLAVPILKLLFNDTNASQMLGLLSPAIIFVATVQISGAVLQAAGKVMIPVKNLLIGAVVKIVINYFLIGIPSVNILGAPIGTGISYMLVTVLNFSEIRKKLDCKIRYFQFFIKPLAASILMGGIVYISYNFIYNNIQSNSIAVLISILLGVIVYCAAIISIGGITKEDLKILRSREGVN